MSLVGELGGESTDQTKALVVEILANLSHLLDFRAKVLASGAVLPLVNLLEGANAKVRRNTLTKSRSYECLSLRKPFRRIPKSVS